MFTEVTNDKKEYYPKDVKAGLYLRNIAEDYKDVAVETFEDMQNRPIKSTIILGLLGGSIYLMKTNPSEDSFYHKLVQNSVDLLEISDAIRNPAADQYIQNLLGSWSRGQLRRLNFGVCCVMWEDKFDKQVDVYEARCKWLRIGWLDMCHHIVDFGIMGKWLNISKAMEDYDINPDEWKDSSNTT